MPRFPEYDFELLTFREACALLPEAAARHLLVHGIEDLHPVYVRWGGELSPQPAPRTWWLNHTGPGNAVDGSAHLLWMLWHENRFGTHWAAGHGGPSEPLEVFFDPERVKAFEALKKWTHRAAGHSGPTEPNEVFRDEDHGEGYQPSKKWMQSVYAEWNVPDEWLAEAGIKWESTKAGRPAVEWHELIAGAANEEEAVKRLPALPKGMDRTFKNKAGGERIRISEAKYVTLKHFLKMLREGRLKSDKE
jgi:hypothetical protein